MKEKIISKYSMLLALGSQRKVTRGVISRAGGGVRKYDNLCKAYDAEFRPATMLEERLVEQLVDLRWRLNEARAYTGQFHGCQGPLEPGTRRGLGEIERHEWRAMKQYDEVFSDLLWLQRAEATA